jgi:membrane-anchored protein YejM (alkaline phosphatase superfamily)
MTFILPEREKGEFQQRTTHYDVAPTLLKRVLRCAGNTNAYSFGKDLSEQPTRDWEIFGNENSFHIVDFANNTMIESDWKGRMNSGDMSRADLVLKAHKEIARFYR